MGKGEKPILEKKMVGEHSKAEGMRERAKTEHPRSTQFLFLTN